MLIAALVLMLPSPQAQPQPAQTPAPVTQPSAAAPASAPVEDPAVTALALKLYGQMRAGKLDATLFTPEMNAALTPEVVTQSKPMLEQLGDPKQFKFEAASKVASGMTYRYLATFPTAQFHVVLLITPAGKVGGYALKP